VLLPVARVVHATRSPLGLPPRPEVAELFRELLVRPLEVLDATLAAGRPFLAGSRATVADCTLAAALQFARFGGVEVDSRCERIVRWDRSYRARPAARSVLSL
jgi:glutathione S-transferase